MSRSKRRYCRKPGRGWYCTWAEGHLAECDEWPDWWMELWYSLKNLLEGRT